jgi:methionyl aminopeptidase
METATLDMGYDLITEFVGHGIGTDLHEPPKVPCYWSGFIGQDFVLEPGMILAIEPMLVLQDPEGAEDFLPPVGDQHAMRRALILTAPDGWTIRTVTGAVSCHEEYMVSIGESGPEILTLGTPRVDYLGKAAG